MKRFSLLAALTLILAVAFAGNVGKTYYFNNPDLAYKGIYTTLNFPNARNIGKTGEPSLPFLPVSLILPAGEKAVSIEMTGEEEVTLPGTYILFPQQEVRPISQGRSGTFQKNEQVYQSSGTYPAKAYTTVQTQYLNGYAFALATFTPVRYNPAAGTITYYKKVTITVQTAPDPKSQKALENLTSSESANNRVKAFAQNPEMMQQYPARKSAAINYQLLIISSETYHAGFTELMNMYQAAGVVSRFQSVEFIDNNMTGQDLQEKIRNYIIQEYQDNNINYVLLGGDPAIVPYRGFYCYVQSGGGYEDYDIPADLYYSGLDGTWNDNGNNKWGEPGEDDLLPDVAVARMPFNDATELAAEIHKTVSFQTNPVQGEFNRPLFAGEHLYDSPWTEGGDYMDLLIDNHGDNGYFTYGVPSSENDILKLYDQNFPGDYWPVDTLISIINTGRSFIHHLGHADFTYALKMDISQITNSTFYLVNGVDHNYTFVYTQGCEDGGFDQSACIAQKMVTIDNFCAAGVFNSRYGWFDEGTTDGPSQHLEREFVSAYNNDTLQILQFGATHAMSKIKTAPWVDLPGEFEPGAQRWCHYDCNALGDPVMPVIQQNQAPQGIGPATASLNFSVYPNPARDRITLTIHAPANADLTITMLNPMGQEVSVPQRLTNGSALSITTYLDLTHCAPGVYFCRVEDGTSSSVKKVVVTR